MADLGNRTNVDTAINLLLNDAQPNEAIQPSDHNTLLINILDTLSSGLSNTLRTNPETSGQDLEVTSGDKIKFKNSTFFGSIISGTLTSDKTYTLPDTTGTIALLSDITGGDSIYTANDTIGTGRVATLTDTLDFYEGTFNLFGLDKTKKIVFIGGDSDFGNQTTYVNNALNLKYNTSNGRGQIYAIDSVGNQGKLNFKGSEVEIESIKTNDQFIIGAGANGNQQGATRSIEYKFNDDYTWKGINLLSTLTYPTAKFEIQPSPNGVGGTYDTAFRVNGNKTVDVLGLDTLSTSSALRIYDGDGTPNLLWDFKNDGTLTGSKSKTTLQAQNTTTNSYTEFTFQALASNGSTRHFFIGNAGEVEIGKGINNTSTGDKSVDCLWGAEGLTRGGSGQYAVVIGSGNNATFGGTGAIAIGKNVTAGSGRTVGIGEIINVSHEHAFAFGRNLTSASADVLLMGSNNISSGRYSVLLGKYLESTSQGASLIGNGNTSTGTKLVNNTANSLGLGWNTTTPQHLFTSTGVNLTLPTSSTGLSSGDLYNDGGTLKIV